MANRPTPLAIGLVVLVASCDSAGDRPTDWAYVNTAILRPSCATAACHSRLGSQAGIDLSTPETAYVFLTGRVCGAPELPGEPVGNFVRPGHPESSQLIYMLRGDGIAIMPPDVPLPDVEIEIIERWILEGATCD